MDLKLTVLPGDGIGPEVTEEAVRVLETVAQVFGHTLSVTRKDIGGAAYLSSRIRCPGHLASLLCLRRRSAGGGWRACL